MSKTVIVLGTSGQDGSYLSELLLSKGYTVHGVIRRASNFNTQRIDHIFNPESKINLHFGDLAQGIDNLIYEIRPDEIYNLAAQSHVRVSFDVPVYTGDINALGVCRILEAIKRGIDNGILKKDIKFYQASSSEMFGQTPTPVGGYTESSIFTPVSPYGVAKLYSYHLTRSYRSGYNLFACNGILFNHESFRRGPTFVTKKVTRIASKIKLGLENEIVLGNLDAKRDWGHSKDYCKAIFAIMQADRPDDWVVASGHHYSIKEFVIKVFNYLDLDWEKYVKYDKSYLRPNEVPELLGNSSKIRKELNWQPEYDLDAIIKEMVDYDLKELEKELK